MNPPSKSIDTCSPSQLAWSIHITFTEDPPSGVPVEVDDDSLKKVDVAPKLLRAFATFFRPAIVVRTIVGGDFVLRPSLGMDLYGLQQELLAVVQLTVTELEANSKRQPPLRPSLAVTHLHCFELLRALSTTHASSGLISIIRFGDEVFQFPNVPPSWFVEPKEEEPVKFFKTKVNGVCLANDGFNRVVLADDSFLLLPFEDYEETYDDLSARIKKFEVIFVGKAILCKNTTFRALPGGMLATQGTLQLANDEDTDS